MLFIDNKYSRWYNTIIKRAQTRTITGYVEKHHIIPKSLGGSNAKSNIVSLTAKEHFICHMLLPKMVEQQYRKKMIHAWWAMSTLQKSCQERYKINASTYSIVRNSYSKKMTLENPMKDPVIQEKRLAAWKANPAAKDFIPPRVLKDKFITPSGIFKTKKEIQKVLNIPEWTLNTIYNNLDALPTSNGRGSKKIIHLSIDISKTWRDNGFDLLSVS